MLEGIRGAIVSLEQRIDRRFEALEYRLTALDQKLDQRTEALEARISRQFIWLVGVQVTTFVAIVAAILAR
jgi:hypothetical protein